MILRYDIIALPWRKCFRWEKSPCLCNFISSAYSLGNLQLSWNCQCSFKREIFAHWSLFFSVKPIIKILGITPTIPFNQKQWSEGVLEVFRPTAYNFIKRRLQHKRFPVNFKNIYRTLFYTIPFGNCFFFVLHLKHCGHFL